MILLSCCFVGFFNRTLTPKHADELIEYILQCKNRHFVPAKPLPFGHPKIPARHKNDRGIFRICFPFVPWSFLNTIKNLANARTRSAVTKFNNRAVPPASSRCLVCLNLEIQLETVVLQAINQSIILFSIQFVHFHGQASPVGVWSFLRLPLNPSRGKKKNRNSSKFKHFMDNKVSVSGNNLEFPATMPNVPAKAPMVMAGARETSRRWRRWRRSERTRSKNVPILSASPPARPCQSVCVCVDA